MPIMRLQNLKLRLKVCHCGCVALMIPGRAPIRFEAVCALVNGISTGMITKS